MRKSGYRFSGAVELAVTYLPILLCLHEIDHAALGGITP